MRVPHARGLEVSLIIIGVTSNCAYSLALSTPDRMSGGTLCNKPKYVLVVIRTVDDLSAARRLCYDAKTRRSNSSYWWSHAEHKQIDAALTKNIASPFV